MDAVPETPRPEEELVGGEEDIDGLPLDHGELLRTHLLWNSGGVPNPEYPVACITTSGSEGVSCILITEMNSRLLVAVPAAAWRRSVSQRVLPARSLQKAVCVALVAADPEKREKPFGDIYAKAWIGYLHPDMEELVDPVGPHEDSLQFWSEDLTIQVLPLAGALLELADDKFCFATAASTGEGEARSAGGQGVQKRLGQLEENMAGVRSGLDTLLANLGKPPAASQAAPSQPRKTAAAKASASSTATQIEQFPGLDPSVVQAALRFQVSRLLTCEKCQG